jgi:hypothetical protein
MLAVLGRIVCNANAIWLRLVREMHAFRGVAARSALCARFGQRLKAPTNPIMTLMIMR